MLQDIGGFAEDLHLKSIEDYHLWIRASCYTNFSYVDEPLVNYSDGTIDSVRSAFTSNQVDKQRRLIWESINQWGRDRKDLTVSRKVSIEVQCLRYQIKMRF